MLARLNDSAPWPEERELVLRVKQQQPYDPEKLEQRWCDFVDEVDKLIRQHFPEAAVRS